jgi:phage terminase small subunit
MTKLTPKQEKFCKAYIETGNASEAYRRAYNAENMKPTTVNRKAVEVLSDGKITARIAELQEGHQKRHEVTVDRVVRELSLLGFSNMLDYISIEAGGAYVDLSKVTREQAAAIGEITSETYMEGHGEDAQRVKRTRFKLTDKRAALVDLGKHLGMFKERIEHTGKDGGPIETKETSDLETARAVGFMLGRALGAMKGAKDDAVGA